ncbi:uncharacterized protein LOC134847552 [Symsagittifera roscoffensis]|uniref:uncharacterized protein LOC134847552 n=1 Tax=Symsagittifera roscoffensis TaxID=84072 RepID=UPI00307B1616
MVISRGVAQTEALANRNVANRYRLRKKLGQGQYGTVYLVEDDQSLYSEEKLKVLKEIHVGEMPPDETIDAMREAKLQAKLDHVGVVKCFNNFLDKDFFCIISEYCDGGDLGLLIEKAKKEGSHFSEIDILDYFCQVVLATRYMHQKQILHRDLKPRNIFVKDNTCKLGDFGISRVLMGTADMASTFIGTPYYMSPECLKHEGYDAKSDMWSLGVILYELCTFEHCFDGESMMAVMYKITQGKIPKLPETFSLGLRNIYEKLVQRNQNKRYSAAQVLKDPFISNHLQKMKKRVSEEWVHSIEIAKNILDQEPAEPNLPNVSNGPTEAALAALSDLSVGFIVSDELRDNDDTLAPLAQTVIHNGGGGGAKDAVGGGLEVAEIKTATELAQERKRKKQLEEERLIREATKNTWLENYKHRENVKRLYHSQDATISVAMQPHRLHPPPSYQKTHPSTLPTPSESQPQMSAQYSGPVLPKPTRISSPESVAPKRVATAQGDKKPLNLKASLSSSPEDQDRLKKSDVDEDSGFSSVNASNDSSSHQQQDNWNNRPITAKNRLFEEILEEELRKSGDVSGALAAGGSKAEYSPSGVIPKKPFVPLKKGSGKMAYNSHKQQLQNNQRRRKAKKKRARGGDEADGGNGNEMQLEYDYEDDFEDYIASDPEMDPDYDSDFPPEDEQGQEEARDGRGNSKNPDNRPLLFVDAYSPSVKAKKMEKMRSECISKMGLKNFHKVYNYLLTARQRSSNEAMIMEDLMKIHSVSEDNFQVDQLIFLESTS